MLKLSTEEYDLIDQYIEEIYDEHSEYVERLLKIYDSDFRSDFITKALKDQIQNIQDALEEYEADKDSALLKDFLSIVSQVRQFTGSQHDSIAQYISELESKCR